jgi:hypothetical protein
MKVLIMVLSVKDNSLYENLVSVIKKTWDNEIVDDFQTIYYYGNNGNNETIFINNELFTYSKEGYSTMGYKVIDALEYIFKNFEFDYIFKMNCSSYLNKKFLKEFLQDKPTEKYYCGVIGVKTPITNVIGVHSDIRFGSGCGSILSRDVVEIIISNKKKWDHSYIEDVSIGKILMDNGIKVVLGERVDIINGVDYNLINKKCYHYRCKNSKDRNLDSVIMNELYKRYKNI